MVLRVFLNKVEKEIMSEIHCIFLRKNKRHFRIGCEIGKCGKSLLWN